MPKVKGPLLSLEAWGQFGKSLIFKHGGVVVKYFQPRDTKSATQLEQRDQFLERYVDNLATLTGAVIPFAGAAAPAGWLLCNGQSVLRTAYKKLFQVIGDIYGAADGTHFNLPDLRHCVPVGVGLGLDDELVDLSLGEKVGSVRVTLSESEMPGHTHGMNVYGSGSSGTDAHVQKVINNISPVHAETFISGEGESHQNMQPSIGLNYIIKV